MDVNSTGTAAAGSTVEREFTVTRVFDAPRERVLEAWEVPALAARWCGPKSFTTTCTIELRPGGSFHLCMRSEQGFEVWCRSIYREIVAPERLVSTVSFPDAQGNRVPPPQ